MSGFVERKECPACGRSPSRTVYSRGYQTPEMLLYMEHAYHGRAPVDKLLGGSYEICECNRCSLVYQRFVPDPEMAALLYDGWIDPVRSRQWHDSGRTVMNGIYEDRISFVVRLIGSTKRTLDYGAGFGGFVDVAIRYGLDVAALEVSKLRSDEMKMRGVRVIDSLSNESFDFINLDQVLEHVVDPRGLMRRLFEATRVGGVVYVSVPDASGMVPSLTSRAVADVDGLVKMLGPLSALQHINGFTPKALQVLASDAGFQPIHRPLMRALCSGYGRGLFSDIKTALRPFRDVFSTNVFLKKTRTEGERNCDQ